VTLFHERSLDIDRSGVNPRPLAVSRRSKTANDRTNAEPTSSADTTTIVDRAVACVVARLDAASPMTAKSDVRSEQSSREHSIRGSHDGSSRTRSAVFANPSCARNATVRRDGSAHLDVVSSRLGSSSSRAVGKWSALPPVQSDVCGGRVRRAPPASRKSCAAIRRPGEADSTTETAAGFSPVGYTPPSHTRQLSGRAVRAERARGNLRTTCPATPRLFSAARFGALAGEGVCRPRAGSGRPRCFRRPAK